MSEFQITDQSSNHKFRTELPNIIFELGLTGNEFSLYAAIKKCAGDHGKCTMSLENLAKICNSSVPTVKRCLKSLCEVNPILKKPLIIKKNRNSEHGDRDTSLIMISDIWPDNYQKFCGEINLNSPQVNLNQGVRSKRTDGGIKLSYKEEPFNKNQYEEEPPPPLPPNFSESKIESVGGGGEKGKENMQGVKLKNLKGEEVYVSDSEIFSYFLKSEFSTEIILEAIKQANNWKKPVSDILKWMEGICTRLLNEKNTKEKECHNKKKSLKESEKKNSEPEKPKKGYWETATQGRALVEFAQKNGFK